MATLEEQRDELNELLRSGVTASQYGDQRVQYASRADIVAARDELDREIAAAAATPLQTQRRFKDASRGW